MIDSLHKECIEVGGTFSSKNDVLKKIASLAKKSAVLDQISEGEILSALENREEISSTGIEKGLAIPHCSFDGLKEFVTGLLIVPNGVDFSSFDGNPARFIFFIVGPSDNRNKHIKILSSISKLGMEQDVLDKLSKAGNPDDALTLLSPSLDDEVKEKGVDKCQFIIHVQREELFLDILEVLTSRVEGDVTVLNSDNAGTFLNKLPLFSSFWTDTEKSFSKVIMAVIDRRLMNDTIRRINLIRPDDGSGALISVHECLYADGNVDF